jgi:hypothetical protein
MICITDGTSLPFVRRIIININRLGTGKEIVPTCEILQIIELVKNFLDRIIDLLFDLKVFTFIHKIVHGSSIGSHQQYNNYRYDFKKTHRTNV